MKKFNYKNKMLILSSLLSVAPILAYLYFYELLPALLPVHFDVNGIANGFISKNIAIVLLPSFFLVINIVLYNYVFNKEMDKQYSIKMINLIIFFTPFISIAIAIIIIIYSLNYNLDMGKILSLFSSILLIIIGNYLPKLRQNSVIGIRIPWVYTSEANWKKTHLVGGRLFVISGLAMLFCSLFNFTQFHFYIFIIAIVLPCGYSFYLYCRKI